MDFGSNYGWIKTSGSDDEEDIVVENAAQDLWSNPLFSAPDTNMELDAAPAAPAAPVAPISSARSDLLDQLVKRKAKRIRQTNTNVISINFGTLIESVQLSTGDPIFCENCRAVLSVLSILEEKGQSKDEVSTPVSGRSWKCEFCNTPNVVDIEPEEIPTGDSIDYILEAAPDAVKNLNSDVVIFVLDISGSMCVSYEIEGKIQLKGKNNLKEVTSQHAERNHLGGYADQWLPNERRDITYVTRLQCVQAAISGAIDTMYKENPNRKVGLVTFNGEVSVLGDGLQLSETVVGDKLNNYEQLFKVGQDFEIQKTVSEAQDALNKKLFNLEETGPTALGPALVIALGIATKAPGSKIVICTDGLSNVGLGAMDALYDDAEKDKVAQFYSEIGLFAQNKGTSIDVISIKGDDCSIENIGKLCELTAGTVDRVTPLEITKNFQSILSLPVLATHVTATLRLHANMQLRIDDADNETRDDVKDIGNVTEDTGVTFEYGVKKGVKDFGGMTDLPFQVQIRYSKLNGMKCMRVISKKLKVTEDRELAEENADLAVLGMNAVQATAKLAAKGDYSAARFLNLKNKSLFGKVAKSAKQKAQVGAWEEYGRAFEREIADVQQVEYERGNDFSDDDEDNDFEGAEDEEMEESSEAKSEEKKEGSTRKREKEQQLRDKKEKKEKARRNNRADATSNMVYQMKSAPMRKFK